MMSTYHFEKKSGYLYMTCSGEYDLDDFITYLKIIYDRCENEGIYKILMNCMGIKGIDIPTIERYLMGVEAAEQLRYKVKLAFVWHAEYLNHIGEMVAVNRGAKVGVFSTITSAANWLLLDINQRELL